jgi:hypothetical protein
VDKVPGDEHKNDGMPVHHLVLPVPSVTASRYLNMQRLNYLRTIRHSSARIAGNLIT